MQPERPWMALFRSQTRERREDALDGWYSEQDIAYMQSLAAAVVQRTPRYFMRVLAIIALALITLVIWMGWAELDTVVRGKGKVIPSSQVQVIQSLEGGVVSEILVHEGDTVKANQPLLKISDIAFNSSYGENRQHYLELLARISRLKAESNDQEFQADPQVEKSLPALSKSEHRLYLSDKQQLDESLGILQQQVRQQQIQLEEAKAQEKQLSINLTLLRKEKAIKKPLVEQQVISEVEFLQLQGKEAETDGRLQAARLSLARLQAAVEETKRKIDQTRLDFHNKATKQLHEAMGDASRLGEAQTALEDRVRRSMLRSPVDGTVKRLLINTVGGVVKPGSDVIEVVPGEDTLLVEVQVAPADIAEISVGQAARVKFSAYDFAIYGSLEGKVIYVSADTLTDEKGHSYYVVRIRPSRNYLGPEARPLPIKVGMTTEADIVTGKKTILHYLLFPIYRAMDNALRER